MKKKERKIKNIRTYYLANEDLDLQEKIDELAYKERITNSNIIIDALTEYLEKHGDGNPVFTLDQFSDPNFQECPAFFRDVKIWNKYLSKVNLKRCKEISTQAEIVLNAINKSYKNLHNLS